MATTSTTTQKARDFSTDIKIKKETIVALEKALTELKAGVNSAAPPPQLSAEERTQFLISQSTQRSQKINETKNALDMAKSELAQLNQMSATEALKIAIENGTQSFEAARLKYNKEISEAKTAWDAMVAEAQKCPQLVDPGFPRLSFEKMLKIKGFARVTADGSSGKYAIDA